MYPDSMSKTAGTFLFNPAQTGTCRDSICEMFLPQSWRAISALGLWKELQETISKRSATLKKPVPAENL
jgi:hypothetical protein